MIRPSLSRRGRARGGAERRAHAIRFLVAATRRTIALVERELDGAPSMLTMRELVVAGLPTRSLLRTAGEERLRTLGTLRSAHAATMTKWELAARGS